jgi:hypothetical protein
MKRILAVAAALLCGGMLNAGAAEAQCGQKCTTVVDADLNIIGYGCVQDSDSRNTCTATASTCALERCGGSSSLILDSKGTALASARVCGDQLRDFELVAVVPAETATWTEIEAKVGLTKRPMRSASATD